MSRSRRAVGALVVLSCLAGCSSDDEGFSIERTQACLQDAGLKASRNDGNTVVAGSGGQLRVEFGYGKQWIYVVFGKDAEEAQAIEEQAVAAATRLEQVDRETVLAGVRRKDNVFFFADGGPVPALEGGRVEDCLE